MNRRHARTLGVAAAGWLAAATMVGYSGLLALQPVPWVQVVIACGAIGALAATLLPPSWRGVIEHAGPAPILLFHVTRFVGIYFLWLVSQGRLPPEWGPAAGWGDIAVAVGGLLLLATRAHRHRVLLLTWNVVGLLDIALVVAGAGMMMITRPGSMDELLRLPLAWLPTFVVPVIIASHIVVFVHARTWSRQSSDNQQIVP